MANILIGTAPAISHLFQTFGFANDLKSRGHVVTYILVDDKLRSYVESRGFRFYHFRQVGDFTGGEPQGLLDKLVPMAHKIRRLIKNTREWHKSFLDNQVFQTLVDALTPDLAVLEVNQAVYALPLMGWKIPAILVCSDWPRGYRDNVPDVGSHFIPTSSRLSRYRCLFDWLRVAIGKYINMKLFGFFILGMDIFKYHRRIAQHYGLSLQDLFDREWPIEHLLLPEICLCPAALDFPRKPRANCRFLDSGIRTDEPEAAKGGGFPWHSVKPDTPMVFCSFGSIILDSRRWQSLAKRVLTEIIRSFSGQSRFQLVVRVGARFDMSWAASLPDNIMVINNWVPQLKLLQRASVHITHGGFSSVRESIEFQVPMIVIPFVNDQPGTAARVVYHNLGFRVMPKKVVGVEIVELSRQLCDSPTYKQNLSEMKLKFDRQREKQSAADLIESHLVRR